MVRATGLEPARRRHENLNLACLPIPSRPRRLNNAMKPCAAASGGTSADCVVLPLPNTGCAFAGGPVRGLPLQIEPATLGFDLVKGSLV